LSEIHDAAVLLNKDMHLATGWEVSFESEKVFENARKVFKTYLKEF